MVRGRARRGRPRWGCARLRGWLRAWWSCRFRRRVLLRGRCRLSATLACSLIELLHESDDDDHDKDYNAGADDDCRPARSRGRLTESDRLESARALGCWRWLL